MRVSATPAHSSFSVSHLITLCPVFTTHGGVQPLSGLLITLNSFSPTPPIIPFSSLPSSPFLSVLSCSVYPNVPPCFYAGTFPALPSPTRPFPQDSVLDCCCHLVVGSRNCSRPRQGLVKTLEEEKTDASNSYYCLQTLPTSSVELAVFQTLRLQAALAGARF